MWKCFLVAGVNNAEVYGPRFRIKTYIDTEVAGVINSYMKILFL